MNTMNQTAAKELRTKISKLGTAQLVKRFNEGKFTAEEREIALIFLEKRNVMDQVTLEEPKVVLVDVPTGTGKAEFVEEDNMDIVNLVMDSKVKNTNEIKFANRIEEAILLSIMDDKGVSYEKGNKTYVLDPEDKELIDEEFKIKKSEIKESYKNQVTEVYKVKRQEVADRFGIEGPSKEVYKIKEANSELRKFFLALQKEFLINL